MGNDPLMNQFPALFELDANKDCKISDRLSINGGGSRYVWQWRRPLGEGQETIEMIGLCSLLHSVELKKEKDRWAWTGSSDKQFNVGAVKWLLNKNIGYNEGNHPGWCKWLPSKCNVFIWRAGLDKLATMDALKRRNIDRGDSNCVLCGEGEESMEHLFTSCCFAAMLCPIISLWCKILNIFAFSVNDLLDTHEHIGLKGIKKEVVQGIIRIGCWSIWKARNEARFNNKIIKLEGIIREIKTVGFLWFNSR
ncbi:uncharacterized protein LOC110870066 [Helianthus annuus]|uniref:uncharacterized protein LOC110870066 n=1 Tax=Helianthus annuus TaxID=4232 RepID=UPI000B8F3569|nr:uncharacterized protein LOC110870066 [Helianthus annuus]